MNLGIPYNNELHDVDNVEYAEWEDALDNVTGRTKADRQASEEWITYDFLMGRGYFVKQPTVPKPTGDATKSNVPIVDTSLPKAKVKREPKWTPSKILREREQLVKLQEKQLAIQKKILARERDRIIEARLNEPIPLQMYKADGTPYTHGNYISAIIAISILAILAVICSLTVLFAAAS